MGAAASSQAEYESREAALAAGYSEREINEWIAAHSEDIVDWLSSADLRVRPTTLQRRDRGASIQEGKDPY